MQTAIEQIVFSTKIETVDIYDEQIELFGLGLHYSLYCSSRLLQSETTIIHHVSLTLSTYWFETVTAGEFHAAFLRQ